MTDFADLTPDEQAALVAKRQWEQEYAAAYAAKSVAAEKENLRRAEAFLREIARRQLGPEKSEEQVLAERAAAQRRCEWLAREYVRMHPKTGE